MASITKAQLFEAPGALGKADNSMPKTCCIRHMIPNIPTTADLIWTKTNLSEQVGVEEAFQVSRNCCVCQNTGRKPSARMLLATDAPAPFLRQVDKLHAYSSGAPSATAGKTRRSLLYFTGTSMDPGGVHAPSKPCLRASACC